MGSTEGNILGEIDGSGIEPLVLELHSAKRRHIGYETAIRLLGIVVGDTMISTEGNILGEIDGSGIEPLVLEVHSAKRRHIAGRRNSRL